MTALHQIMRLVAGWLLSACMLLAWAQDSESEATSAASEQQPAQLSLFVFSEQIPVQGVRVLLNGNPLGVTNDAGRITAKVPVGEQTIAVESVDFGSLRREILFTDNEVIQILVNLFADGRTPFVDIETSNPNKALSSSAPAQQVDAEPGFLEGRVVSAEDGSPQAGVRVFVSGTPQEVTTGEDGSFRFELQPGEYAISVLASRFNTRTLDGIPVVAEQTTSQNLELTPAGSELPEFVVVVPYVAGSLASVLEERREEASVADYLGAEQISRAGDGDVASALRRVTGLTLVDGRFIFIRGLGERYSSTILNGADVPSPDPTRRVVPLDLFPTSIVESIQVQKSFTPEAVPDFGGGVVQIRTRSVPESNYLQVEIGGGYNTQTTFKDGLRYTGGDNDIFGFDDGTRAIPDLLDAATSDGLLVPFNPFTGAGFSDAELEAIGESLPNIYDVRPQTIEPNFEFGIAGGMVFDFGWLKLGGQAAVDLSNSWRTTSQIRRSFAAGSGDDLEIRDDLVFDITERNVDLTGFASVGAELGEHHKLTANAILLRNTTDEAEVQEGTTFEFDTVTRITQIEFEERELQTYQFLGEHVFPWINSSTLNWQYTTATAGSDIPDFRSYRYEFDPSTEQFLFASRADGNQRNYSALDDSSQSFNVDLGLKVLDLDNYGVTIKTGYSDIQKDRESRVRRFRFEIRGPLASNEELRANPSLEEILSPEFIDPDGFEVEDITSSSDTYTADLENTAFYYGLDVKLFGWLRLYGGIREDDFLQEVITFDPFDVTDTPVVSLIDTKDSLPSITATISFPWDTEVRLGFAETVNRPQFRELTPADFIDPILDNLAIGNPDLLPASIKHYDFRIDKYFSESELISFGAFYKEFTAPIEAVIRPGANQLISFANAESAENFGFEFEFYKSFDFLGGFWEDFYASANFAYIESTVTIAPQNASIQTNAERALQGQSPFVINAQLGYSNPDNGITATLLYNTAGERIVQVGTLGRPDIFEQPFNQLDFVVRYKWKGWTYRLNLRNLLDDEVEFTQGPETTRLFTRGREFTLAALYRWD